jgi:FkbM family methyltransferase
VLYGKGKLGQLAASYLREVGHPEIAHIERDEYADSSKQVAVCVVSEPYATIERTLSHRFSDIFPFYDITEYYRHIHPLNNGWYAGAIGGYAANVLANWSDDTSRAHHLQFLAWRRLREEWTFSEAPVEIHNRYFIPEIKAVLTCKESFMDVGACYGEAGLAFKHHVGGYYEKLISIEPDAENRKVWKRDFHDPLAIVVDRVISDEEGMCRFHEGLGYMSQIASTTDKLRPCQTIDSLESKPTFIKLHIEGHEFKALKGAKQTIWDNRPIIAATVYHNPDGVWKTPLWLMENLPDYKFLFRLHGWCGTGAVVYCIPKERV